MPNPLQYAIFDWDLLKIIHYLAIVKEVAAVFSVGGGGLRAPLSQFGHSQSQNSALWQGFLGVKFTYFIRSPINLVGLWALWFPIISMNYFKNDQQMAKKLTNYEARG